MDGSAGLASARSTANRFFHSRRRYGETGGSRQNNVGPTGSESDLLTNAAHLYSASQRRRHEFQDYLYPEIAGGLHSSTEEASPSAPDFRFASTVQTWGDYLVARYHPRSMVGIGGRTAYGDYSGSRDARDVAQDGSSFQAFSQGSALVHEDLYDPARQMLEETDGIQGIQSIVDVDSGFGSFGYEYLNFLREECPKAPILVFGAIPPLPAVSAGGSSQSVGGIDYHTRDRATLRNTNLALGLAHFAGRTELDALYIPLSLQSYLHDVELASHSLASQQGLDTRALQDSYLQSLMQHKTLASWFSGLSALQWDSKYQTSALLASAIDSFTLAFRLQGTADAGAAQQYSSLGDDSASRAPHYSGETVLPLAKMIHEDKFRLPGDKATSTASAVLDSRMRHSRMEDNVYSIPYNNLYNAEIETASSAPLSLLSSSLTMREMFTFLKRTPSLNIATIALTLPAAFPYASASAFDRVLSSVPPVDQLGLHHQTPLSWTTKLPAWKYHNFHEPESAEVRDRAMRQAPFAHVLISRGIGSHNLTSTMGYYSLKRAYSQSLDNYLSRTYCHAAGHVIARTPLPLPMTFPTLLPAYAYDEACALVVDPRCTVNPTPPLLHSSAQAQEEADAQILHHVKSITASATISPTSVHSSSALPRTSTTNPDGTVQYVMNISGNQHDGVVTPYSMPVLAHVSVSPEYYTELEQIHRSFMRRDRATDFRNRSADSQGLEMNEVADILQDLCDAYAAND